MSERDRITVSCQHESAFWRNGGAQVYTGDTAAVFARYNRLRGYVTPDPKMPLSGFAYDIPPEYLYFYEQPHLDKGQSKAALYTDPEKLAVLAEATRRGLLYQKPGDLPDATLLYSQYHHAGVAGVEANKSLREPIPHAHMAHTWQLASGMVGVGTTDEILAGYFDGSLVPSQREFSRDRLFAELQILQGADVIAVQTNEEQRIIASVYSEAGLLHPSVVARYGIKPDEVSRFAQSYDQIVNKFIHVPLGINPRWHEIGRATDWEREQYRRAAKANLVQTLYNLRASRPPEWSDAHEKLAQMPEDTTHFYFAGRFQPGKGVVNTLKGYIEFVAGMKQSSPESLRDKKYSMIFGGPIGEPVYSEFMQVLADTEPELRKSVMESLIVVGGIDFFDLTVMGHVFMGTSDNESFYLTLAEAMAVGNATAVTDYPTIRGVSGFDDRVYDYEENQLDMDSRPILLNPNNPSEIAQAMETYRDERQRLMNGDRNRLVAMNYSSLSSAEIFTAQTTRKLKNGHHWSLTM